MNNQYLLFSQDWYPNAGWEDFIGSFNSKENAINKGVELVNTTHRVWYQVVDLSTLSIVAEYWEPAETDHLALPKDEVDQEPEKDL